MTQSTNPQPAPGPSEEELVALYWACQRYDVQATDEIAAGINVRLGVGDDETPTWLLDLVKDGIAAQLAEQPAEPGQACAA